MKRLVFVISVLLLSAWPALAGDVTNVYTDQGGHAGGPCGTTGNLPAATFSKVASDDAGYPCMSSTTGVCDLDDPSDIAYWSYIVHGKMTFGPPSSGQSATAIEVQTYIGGGGGVCTGGSTVQCASGYKLVEDSTYSSGTNNIAVPYDAAEFNLPSHFSTPGDGNFQAFFVFAMPIGGSVSCSTSYITHESN